MRVAMPWVGVLTVLCGSAVAAQLPGPVPAEGHGFESAGLAEVVTAADESGAPIHSVMVIRGGDVVLDARFYPYDGSLHDMASVTKSVMTTLIGIAAGEGRLTLDAPMLSFFPDVTVANRDARKEAVTVEQLTRNVSGLACVGSPQEVTLEEMEASPDFVQFALDLPMAYEPGGHFDYCSPGMHLLSAILQKATGMTALAYARDRLFAPIGIADVAWDSDPQGVTRGWGDLHLTPEDMARLGQLWLDGGAWDGRQVVPADWLADATTRAGHSDRYEDYGAGFWVGPASEPIPYFFASGRGGQRILVAPALDIIMTTTGGGIDPGDIIDPIIATLRDPTAALAPDPDGEAKLAAAVMAVAAPPVAEPVAALPAMARAISGRTYRFEENPHGVVSVRFDFPGGEAGTITLVAGGDATPRPVGLDGVYRWSAGPNGVRYGDRGRWRDADTLVVDHNTIGDIRSYTLTARFIDGGNSLGLTIMQRDEVSFARLWGRAE